MYRLIAYKSDSVDTCRGCVMAQYGADLVDETRNTEEAIVERIAELESFEREHGEHAYEIVGVFRFLDPDAFDAFNDTYNWPEGQQLEVVTDRVRPLVEAFKKRAAEAAARREAEAAAAAERAKVEAARLSALRIEEAERATYARLKEKYGTE